MKFIGAFYIGIFEQKPVIQSAFKATLSTRCIQKYEMNFLYTADKMEFTILDLLQCINR